MAYHLTFIVDTNDDVCCLDSEVNYQEICDGKLNYRDSLVA